MFIVRETVPFEYFCKTKIYISFSVYIHVESKRCIDKYAALTMRG